MSGAPAPEFLSSRKDIPDSIQPWDIQRVHPIQGGATNIAEQVMRVPFGDDPYSRAVRRHEMVHARISPARKEACMLFTGLDPMLVEAGEEFRVNTTMRRAGFDADALASGTEAILGARLASGRDWFNMVYVTGLWAGTKAFRDFADGIASVDRDAAEALRDVEALLLDCAEEMDDQRMTDTTPSKTFRGVPRGFTRCTTKFAKILSRAASAADPAVTTDGTPLEFDDEADGTALRRRVNGGQAFARLILDTTVTLDQRVSGKLGRKRVATDMGRNPRRINRMLTDPHRRVFDRYAKGQGGVVLIDQSGSMHLDRSDVEQIVEAAPGCVIIGYSHCPGSTEMSNVWVIADRGRMTSDIPEGNGGNGVDGPAIRFAQSKRLTGEPFIWVCDGDVTDANDLTADHLSEECASLVVKHGIHMVRDTDDAVQALQDCARGVRLAAAVTGPLRHTEAWKAFQDA